MLALKRSDVRCRLIVEADRDGVVACLARGFPYRRKAYWARALERMAQRPAIDDFPRYGYVLESSGEIVGVILVIYSRRSGADGEAVRANLSSWCVDKEFRSFATILHAVAVKRRDVTYLNVSPAPHTRPGIEALGFRRFCEGQLLFAPLLSAPARGARVAAFAPGAPEAALLSPDERQILADHAALGCRALIGVKDGIGYPFVLQHRAVFHRLAPCEQLIYCRDMAEFVLFAGSIGRYMMARGWPIFIADANGPTPGLVGRFFAGYGPKYFKGPVPPRLGDLAYTELAILGP